MSPRRYFPDVRALVRGNVVPLVSVVAALVTCCIVLPDAGYAGYVDWGTLGRLACVLLTVAGLRESGVFQALALAFARRCAGARAMVFALVGATALASMFVTNDMALLALLPLSAACLIAAGRRDLIGPTYVLQGVAANLCGMLLPFGNPQNIYLAACYGIGFGDFVGTMLAPFALSVAIVAVGGVAAGRGGVRPEGVHQPVDRRGALAFGLLLVACVLCVLGVLPVWACVAVVALVTLAVDRRLPLRTDWGLIVTFAAFFVFSGNLARIEVVSDAFASWTATGAFVPGAVLSQVISNVPAAIVLSRFTGDWAGLLAGVNVGGAGTPVASLATLIVVTQYLALRRGLERGGASGGSGQGAGPDHAAGAGEVADEPDAALASPGAGTPAASSPAGRLQPTGRFMALLVGVNMGALAVLLMVGVLLGW